ncbi:MAG: hypothetical protein JWR30_3535 [Conexibacter sp.]|nr:hypothetical protein [Conexibacter sp.]
MTVLLAKSNLLRRAPWRLETLIVEDGDGLHVVKRGPSSADPAGRPPRLGTLAERHAVLAAAAGDAFALPRILHAGERELRIEHVAGQTSLARLERRLCERRFAAAQAEIDDVLTLLDQLPGVLADPMTTRASPRPSIPTAAPDVPASNAASCRGSTTSAWATS